MHKYLHDILISMQFHEIFVIVHIIREKRMSYQKKAQPTIDSFLNKDVFHIIFCRKLNVVDVVIFSLRGILSSFGFCTAKCDVTKENVFQLMQ